MVLSCILNSFGYFRPFNSYLEMFSSWLFKRVNLQRPKKCEHCPVHLQNVERLPPSLVTLFCTTEGRNPQRWLCHLNVLVWDSDLYRIQSYILSSWNSSSCDFCVVVLFWWIYKEERVGCVLLGSETYFSAQPSSSPLASTPNILENHFFLSFGEPWITSSWCRTDSEVRGRVQVERRSD